MRPPREAPEAQISRLLDAAPDLLPYLPELLRDLDALGGSPDLIAERLRGAGLEARSTTVLDLGCGKGAVAIRLARKPGFRVDGVDLFEPFVEEARRKAAAEGVDDRCRFRPADVRDVLAEGGSYDVVVFASMGGLFPDNEETVGRLRDLIRTGGHLVLEDGFLHEPDRAPPEGYEHYRGHDETLESLRAFGDLVVAETIVPIDRVRRENEENARKIAARAAGLAHRHPEMADRFRWYAAEQRRQGRLAESVETAVWLLQKGSE